MTHRGPFQPLLFCVILCDSPFEDTHMQRDRQTHTYTWIWGADISLKNEKPLTWKRWGCFSCPAPGCGTRTAPRAPGTPTQPPNPTHHACCSAFSLPFPWR